MSNKLTLEIVQYILSNLGMINEYAVSKSILEKDFLLPEKLVIIDEDKEYSNKVRGCSIIIDINNTLQVIASKGVYNSGITDYFIILQLNNDITYGLSLTLHESEESLFSICYYLDGIWIDCDVTQQSKLLLSMETIKNLSFGWKKITDHKLQYKLLLSFAKHISSGGEDEGQKD